MHLLSRTFHTQVAALRRSPWITGLVLLTFVAVLAFGVQHDRAGKALAYLAVICVGAFIVDLFAQWRPTHGELPVRQPRREATYVLICMAIGYATLIARFAALDWQALPGMVRLAILPGFACVFPIAIAFIMFLLRYKPRELGLRFPMCAWMFIPILLLTAITAYLIAPQDLSLQELIASEGVIGTLFMGIFTAGLSEEFSRMLVQTRVGAFLGSKAAGWFIASVLWAFMHAPKWYGDERHLYEALMGSLRIVPLGLLWGYITHRTQSIVPATLVHGLNVWGLQNF